MDEVEKKVEDIQDSMDQKLDEIESLIEYFLDNRECSGLLDD